MRACRRKKRRLPYVAAVIALFIIGALVYLRVVVAPVVKSVSEEEIKALTTTAVNRAVIEALEEIPDYTEVVSFHYDVNQKVNLLQVNSLIVNEIVQNSTLKAQEKLGAFGMRGVSIPMGSLTGFMSLSGKGPSVNIKTVPIGSIDTNLFSEFTEAGINQTRHRVFLRLDASVSVVLPGANNVVNTLTEVVIVESVIVGEIPETYLNSTSTQDMMDLIP